MEVKGIERSSAGRMNTGPSPQGSRSTPRFTPISFPDTGRTHQIGAGGVAGLQSGVNVPSRSAAPTRHGLRACGQPLLAPRLYGCAAGRATSFTPSAAHTRCTVSNRG